MTIRIPPPALGAAVVAAYLAYSWLYPPDTMTVMETGLAGLLVYALYLGNVSLMAKTPPQVDP